MGALEKGKLDNFRKELKNAFPTYKFSVTVSNYDVLNVCLMKANISYDWDYEQLNHYFLDRIDNLEMRNLWKEVDKLRAKYLPCEDRSDIQADYFDVDYYIRYQIGKYDKRYIFAR